MVDHAGARGDAFVLLRVVAHRHAGTEDDLAGVVGLDAREDAQERGLARAVEPEDQDALAASQREREVRPDRAIAVRLRELVDLEHVAPAVRRRREAVAGGARGADRRDRVRREPFDALVEALGLPGALRARVAHPVGEGRQAPDLGLLARRDLAQPLFVLRARSEVLRVRALVLAQVAFVEVQHLRDRLVEQLEVVAHDEQRAAVRAKEAHQPLLRVDVEVVGGLVEHQVVGAAEQDARQLDAATLATGQRGEREQGAVGGEAEAGEDAVHVGLGAVAAGVAEGLLGVREAADRPLARVVFHVAAELLELVALRVEAAGRQHVRHGDVLGAGAVGAWILGEEAERAR